MPSSHSIKKIFENIGDGFFSKKKPLLPQLFEVLKDDPGSY